MVLGIGIDLCEVARLEHALARFGDRLLERCFTDGERAACLTRRHPAPGLAARFAAKEALAKAIHTGLGGPLGWRDVEVVRALSGQPELRLTGGGAAWIAARWGMVRLHLSLTHERGMAAAVVIVEG